MKEIEKRLIKPRRFNGFISLTEKNERCPVIAAKKIIVFLGKCFLKY